MATPPAEPKTADNFDPEKAENLEDVRLFYQYTPARNAN